MPSIKYEWLDRLKAVEREHAAMRLAAEHLFELARRDPATLERIVRVRDLQTAFEHLESTYIIRLFSEFETSLRAFWRTSRGGNVPSRTRDLLEGAGASNKVPHDRIHNAHRVREYRNLLVHEREAAAAPLSIGRARHHLCYFLSFLPLRDGRGPAGMNCSLAEVRRPPLRPEWPLTLDFALQLQ
jgi:hypothetical protein